MRVQTLFICQVCEQRIEYDYTANCYLQHCHTDPQRVTEPNASEDKPKV